MAEPIAFPGTVEWSGENPGISLKTDPDGPFTALASFFRVVLSPHGRGHALVLLAEPGTPGARGNVVLTDNEPLARYLIKDYVANFAAFRAAPALSAIGFRRLDGVVVEDVPNESYAEVLTSGDMTIRLAWEGLGVPFAFAHRPETSATGVHWMPSLFVGCTTARIEVDGAALPGAPVPRMVAGHAISTAMLAFSETWIRV